ncbi:MAG TPA: radical SAM family heme chaperone HemW [Melioribacteraceae bacterium]|nr:radical SAM family heme chaperone HemW [Melioribacteraceae bacterium]
MKETAIYIHIPFCDHKCIYCDFYSIISYENIRSYFQSLKKEINFYAEKFSSGREIISIFLGGGTPSFMEPEYIGEIINEVKSSFNVRENAEVTMETNPGTVSRAKLESFISTGINRISIGIQSFDDKELKFLTRIHDSAAAVETVLKAKEAGFNNISIDLIFNLPGQTKKIWRSNLEQAVALPVKHISAYSLILEPGTILNKMVIDGKVKLESDDHDADLYEFTIDFLCGKGFEQYEVSNFAMPGYESVHNNAYWRYRDYLGFGTSAHSFIDGIRWWNFSSVKFYNEAVIRNQNGVAGKERLTNEQKLNEYVMLALRSKGLDINKLESVFGNEWINKNQANINFLFQNDYIKFDNTLIKFTPKGYALCDELLLRFR